MNLNNKTLFLLENKDVLDICIVSKPFARDYEINNVDLKRKET